MNITEYLKIVKKTDKLPSRELRPVLFGLYGEVGEILALVKKKKREPKSYYADPKRLIDELGDTLWYLCCLGERLNLDMERIINSSMNYKTDDSKADIFVKLGITAGALLKKNQQNIRKELIIIFTQLFLFLAKSHNIDLNVILKSNSEKVASRFIRYKKNELPTFDDGFNEDEQIPEKFEIEFMEKSNGLQALRWNGVFIGDPLTDNSYDKDGYRFHDVFHMSYAAILNWSPVFRGLIQQKRKSEAEIDEVEDGGRATAVEEGISAWIFNIAKDNDYFKNKEQLPFEVLKHVKQAVKGLEVEKCPLSLWEYAILEGYKVFNLLKNHEGKGTVIGDRRKRKLSYKKNT